MNRSLRSLIRLALFVAAGYALFKIVYPTITYRIRLTLAVEQNGEVKTASSVIELETIQYPYFEGLDNLKGYETYVYGEAICMNLGGNDRLVALLSGFPLEDDYIAKLPSHIFLDERDRTRPKSDQLAFFPEALDRVTNNPTPLTYMQMPRLVRFSNAADPQSIEVVDPNNLAARFGPGVALRNATMEITHDPMISSIRDCLPWLKSEAAKSFSVNLRFPNRLPAPFPYHIDVSNFVRR